MTWGAALKWYNNIGHQGAVKNSEFEKINPCKATFYRCFARIFYTKYLLKSDKACDIFWESRPFGGVGRRHEWEGSTVESQHS